MVTRNVVLTTQQADLVERLVSSGRFQNASEALRAGLRLLEQDEYEVIELRERLMVSLRQAKQSQFADGDGKDVVRRAFSSGDMPKSW
jgi:antitoxin ParD1/3/4